MLNLTIMLVIIFQIILDPTDPTAEQANHLLDSTNPLVRITDHTKKDTVQFHVDDITVHHLLTVEDNSIPPLDKVDPILDPLPDLENILLPRLDLKYDIL